MSSNEMFDSQLRSIGDLAGVFEFDGDTGYFYLYKTTEGQDKKVIGAIRVLTGVPDFKEGDVAICWDENESKVGLRIRGRIWAVFDAITGAGYGGSYHPSRQAEIPTDIIAAFKSNRKST